MDTQEFIDYVIFIWLHRSGFSSIEQLYCYMIYVYKDDYNLQNNVLIEKESFV